MRVLKIDVLTRTIYFISLMDFRNIDRILNTRCNEQFNTQQ